MAQATAYEQLMLELINRARLDPAAEAARLGISLNQGMAANTIDTTSKTPLAMNAALIDSARSHSQWMLDVDRFSHTGRGGSTSRERMQDAGYTFSGDWRSGENLAWAGNPGSIDITSTVHRLHDALFKSSTHRFNTLYERFSEVGVGQLSGQFMGLNTAMITQNFARSGTNISITGVAYTDCDGDKFYSVGEADAAVKITVGARAAYTGEAGGYQLVVGNGNQSVTLDDGHGMARVIVTMRGENAKLDYVNSDTILSSTSLTLVSGVNKATLLGTDAISLTGSATNDVLTGNSGANRIDGGAGRDTIYGGAGNDSLVGGAGADKLEGGTGNDSLYGQAGHDALYGQAGNDRLYGQAGNDRLCGDAGADYLVGGIGADKLFGGADADVFVYLSVADSTPAATGRDIIYDFSQAQCDKIELTTIDANALVAGNQAFRFMGERAAFTGTAGELRFQDTGGHTFVFGDINGDRVADFAIELNTDVSLRATDFLL